MSQYDLIVIGAGPGGYETALEAAGRYGLKTALIEKDKLGGTCLNRGCIPTKTLLHTTEVYEEIKNHGEAIGITGGEDDAIDMAVLQNRKNEVLETLRNGIAGGMKAKKVDVYEGLGQIVDAGKVRVVKEDGSSEEIEATNIIIATGSVPVVPGSIPGTDLQGVVTSDELLDLAEKIDSLVIVGGGVIGMEFASVFGAMGVKITVIEALDRIIANLDKELSQSLKMLLKKRGIELHTGAMVTEITGSGGPGTGGLTCHYTEKDAPQEVSADMILLSIGRRANTKDLIPEDAADAVKAIAMERGMFTVDEKYATSVPGIYAIGDVIGGIQLAHVATAEGRLALAAIAGKEPPVDIHIVPSCIYTSPEIAAVGLSADEAKEKGLDVITKKYSMGANGKSVLSLQERGFVKVVADAQTRKVLGAVMMCARATDMITQFSQAIVNGLTIEEMGRVMFPHPTFVEGIGELMKEID